jgi:hypothetical protein
MRNDSNAEHTYLCSFHLRVVFCRSPSNQATPSNPSGSPAARTLAIGTPATSPIRRALCGSQAQRCFAQPAPLRVSKSATKLAFLPKPVSLDDVCRFPRPSCAVGPAFNTGARAMPPKC